ncbi:MAG: NAD-dependent epimerase/dehydratase family protein [Tenericutes bacterium]|nr:NAD-dependent epimerase/dehydratase family protein [Mycoplasmatota bacterium]
MSLYLVTGAAGFIGSAVAKKLISDGNKVVTIDNLSTGYKDNIPKGCKFIFGNDFDVETINSLNEYRFDCIIHIAGQSSGEISFENPVYDLNTNTKSTLMLLKYAQETGCKRFIYASTMSVYGDQKNEMVSELESPNPKSFYAVGKLASENYMSIYSSLGIQCTALRLFNVYGVGQNLGNMKQGMVSIFLKMALSERSILIKGSKDRFRDFVYIDDVVDAFYRVSDIPLDNKFRIYNVSSGIKHTIESLITEISKNIDYDLRIKYGLGTPGDQFGIYGESRKICNELNWVPKTRFSDGISMMVSWAKQKVESEKLIK